MSAIYFSDLPIPPEVLERIEADVAKDPILLNMQRKLVERKAVHKGEQDARQREIWDLEIRAREAGELYASEMSFLNNKVKTLKKHKQRIPKAIPNLEARIGKREREVRARLKKQAAAEVLRRLNTQLNPNYGAGVKKDPTQ